MANNNANTPAGGQNPGQPSTEVTQETTVETTTPIAPAAQAAGTRRRTTRTIRTRRTPEAAAAAAGTRRRTTRTARTQPEGPHPKWWVIGAILGGIAILVIASVLIWSKWRPSWLWGRTAKPSVTAQAPLASDDVKKLLAEQQKQFDADRKKFADELRAAVSPSGHVPTIVQYIAVGTNITSTATNLVNLPEQAGNTQVDVTHGNVSTSVGTPAVVSTVTGSSNHVVTLSVGSIGPGAKLVIENGSQKPEVRQYNLPRKTQRRHVIGSLQSGDCMTGDCVGVGKAGGVHKVLPGQMHQAYVAARNAISWQVANQMARAGY